MKTYMSSLIHPLVGIGRWQIVRWVHFWLFSSMRCALITFGENSFSFSPSTSMPCNRNSWFILQIHLMFYSYLCMSQMWTKNVTCHFSKQRTLCPSRHPELLRPDVGCTQRELRMRGAGYWPQRVKIHIKGMIPMSTDSGTFPYKALKPVTWDVWFLWFAVFFWCSMRCLFSAKTHSRLSWLLPFLFGRLVPRGSLSRCSPRR